ncbi:hypothetical protein CEP53_008511 [Fusarium sp. AF-6]|nr:hypothetical protein CEP53_008511 [Fusarium sp. AF-6]
MSCDPPARSSSGRKHYCATCSKGYSTNSHLRRHQATHAGGAALICPVCTRYFHRTDVGRRHTKKCFKDGEVIFMRSQCGKKRTSCDSCSQRKLACDAAAPCSRCISSKMECTYQRLGASTSSPLPVVRSGNIVATPQDDSAADVARSPVQFLLKFTEPSLYGTSAAVLADTAGQPYFQNVSESPSVPSFSVTQLLFEDPFVWDQ